MKTMTVATLALALATNAASATGYVQVASFSDINFDSSANDALVTGTVVGDDGYFLIKGGDGQRLVKIADLGGAKTGSNFATNFTSLGDVSQDAAGILESFGSTLYLNDIANDAIYTFSTTGPNETAASEFLKEADGDAYAVITPTNSSGPPTTWNPLFGSVDPTDGSYVVYDSNTDSVARITSGSASLVLRDAGATPSLTTVIGDDIPAGLTVTDNGLLVFGDPTGGATEEIVIFDPSKPNDPVKTITEADILPVSTGTDVGFTNTGFFFAPDGRVYFYQNGTVDSIMSFDPDDDDPASTLELVIAEAALDAGPANSSFVSSLTWYNGNIAWIQTLSAGGQVAGLYAIPEPTTLALLGLGGLVMLRRRAA